jgi:hypothetical protein
MIHKGWTKALEMYFSRFLLLLMKALRSLQRCSKCAVLSSLAFRISHTQLASRPVDTSEVFYCPVQCIDLQSRFKRGSLVSTTCAVTAPT